MSDIVWEDPPPAKTTSTWGSQAAFVEELKAHPGKWAIFRSDFTRQDAAGSTGARMKKRYEVEVASRANGDGSATLYTRWPGDAS